jgi:hypothetical protein
VQDVQNVKLEWFPRHVGSLNGAFATQYQVELYAIRVPGMNPQQIVMSMPADYTYVTSRTSHMLTNAEYMLEPGVEYAVRIKAMAGNDELTLFHNNGYSAVTSFIYGSLCPEPADVSAQTIGTDKVEISWTTDPLHTSFTTRFPMCFLPARNMNIRCRHSVSGPKVIIHNLIMLPFRRHHRQILPVAREIRDEYAIQAPNSI